MYVWVYVCMYVCMWTAPTAFIPSFRGGDLLGGRIYVYVCGGFLEGGSLPILATLV